MKLINGVCLFVFKLTPGRNNTVEQLASLQYEDYAAQNCGLFPIIWAHVSRLSCPLYQIYKSCFCSGLLSICLFIHPSISVWCLHRLDKHKSPIRQHVLFSEKEQFAVLASCCIKASCFFPCSTCVSTYISSAKLLRGFCLLSRNSLEESLSANKLISKSY